MMAKIILLFFSYLIVNGVSAQDLIQFEDHYIDNRNSWDITNTGKISSKIEDGRFIMKNTDVSHSYNYYLQHFIDEGDDFYIESKLTLLEEDDNSNFGYGLLWAAVGGGENYNFFYISSNGYFMVKGYLNNVSIDKQEWKKCEFINPVGMPNVLSVTRLNGQLTFAINYRNVLSIPDFNYKGTAAGFNIGVKGTVAADYYLIQSPDYKINLVKDGNKGFEKENLGSVVNTAYGDLSPVVSHDGKTLYFLRKRYPKNLGIENKDDIWVSNLQDDGSWSKAANIGRPLNNDGFNFVVSVSPDNNTLLVGNTYMEDGSSYSSGLSITNRTKNGWEIPKTVKIDSFYNENAYVTYALAPNQKVLLISLERKDSFGVTDLYVCFRKDDNTWSEPRNMGNKINTFADEFAPFVAADNKTLYYATYGKPGYGSADIFVSKRLDNTWVNWSEPQNVGPEINTKKWDGYYSVSAKGESAFIASTENSFGQSDIFNIKLPEELKPDPVVVISGRVFNEETKKPIGAKIYYDDLDTREKLGLARSNPVSGAYKIILPYGAHYAFRAASEGFIAINENINIKKKKDYIEIYKDLYLVPIKMGEIITLQNVFFERASANILPSSIPELNRLLKVMRDNPKIEVEISGHTDSKGDAVQLLRLSRERAEKVRQYLVQHGISLNRISSKGYGPNRPVAGNETENDRKKNRRVEFKIIKS